MVLGFFSEKTLFCGQPARHKSSQQQTYLCAEHPTIHQPVRQLLSLYWHLLLGRPRRNTRHFWLPWVRSRRRIGIQSWPCWLRIAGSVAGRRSSGWGWWWSPGTGWRQSFASGTVWPPSSGSSTGKKYDVPSCYISIPDKKQTKLKKKGKRNTYCQTFSSHSSLHIPMLIKPFKKS